MKTPVIAICVGHSRKIKGKYDGGAISISGVAERSFNLGVADRIADELRAEGFTPVIFSDYQGSGYGTAMDWLGNQINAIDATLAIELHFNSSDTTGNGHEWLHFAGSKNGAILAGDLRRSFAMAFPTLKDRGLKPIRKGERGYEFLRATRCPAVICEPFFGDNQHDWNDVSEQAAKLAASIADGISNYIPF